ncbi:thymidylate kinase [Bacillus mesophilus]|uniref:Thymidylate kinase-like domain-containing protein n=1 Tax=Bacillus mesophilus TaxID=1808955 RepID=A0A6M0Q7K9_9BACI|nr:hypothetical protein [Bacillus mesophilus]MBM7661629.1 thymidylate kinase [Bacillus mesophilus]NEY72297.1 hypothetical protein [Bacillus mesophilus]
MDKDEFIWEIIKALNLSNFKWCIPSGYQELPRVNSDIDVIVSEKPIMVVKYLLNYFAGKDVGWKLVHLHKGKNCYCVFASVMNNQLDYLFLDLSQHYYYQGKKVISGDIFLEKVELFNQIPIPSVHVEFIYIFIKRVGKLQMTEEQFARLSESFYLDPTGCLKMLKLFWSDIESKQIEALVMEKDYEGLQNALPEYRNRLLTKNLLKLLSLYYCDYQLKLVKLIRRIWHSPGLEVICLGPDGSGKSTTIKEIESFISPLLKVRKYHLRSFPSKVYKGDSMTKKSPYGESKQNKLVSIVKIVIYFLTFWFGRVFITNPQKLQTRMILFDRSYHDITIDPSRFRLNCPAWFTRLISTVFPKPDLFFIFDAPTEVIQARKQEVSYEETEQQRINYLAFAEENRDTAFIINTEDGQGDTLVRVMNILFCYMEDREKVRLKVE